MKVTPRLLFAALASLAVVAAVVYGVILAGSPSKERDRQFDAQRVARLGTTSSAVEQSYAREKRLPDTARDLLGTGSLDETQLHDPRTGEPFEYRVTGETTYELCATFALASEDDGLTRPYVPPEPVFPAKVAGRWNHPAGRYCFTLDAKQASVGETCDIYRACREGQTCAKLPGKAEAVCVVAGQECAAAGCPAGDCQVLESYPAQVVCGPGPVPEPTAGGCSLWREKKTGRVDCFGCVGRACTDPAVPAWEPYDAPAKPGYVGIPYSCYETPEGCRLAQ